jgi:hypothetical protein
MVYRFLVIVFGLISKTLNLENLIWGIGDFLCFLGVKTSNLLPITYYLLPFYIKLRSHSSIVFHINILAKLSVCQTSKGLDSTDLSGKLYIRDSILKAFVPIFVPNNNVSSTDFSISYECVVKSIGYV